jgi:hypothetical protein
VQQEKGILWFCQVLPRVAIAVLPGNWQISPQNSSAPYTSHRQSFWAQFTSQDGHSIVEIIATTRNIPVSKDEDELHCVGKVRSSDDIQSNQSLNVGQKWPVGCYHLINASHSGRPKSDASLFPAPC